MAVYKSNGTGSTLPTNLGISERNLYGSSRLGLVTFNQNIKGTPPSQTQTTPYKSSLTRGNKFYELSNHLGNVLVTISDQKKGHTTDGVTYDYYNADIVTANDYYPFGSTMPGRSSGSYRYGFNGKEKDKDGTTTAIQYDYGARIYDPHLGRFKSIDPLQKKHQGESPYLFAGGNPLVFADPDGRDRIIKTTTIYEFGNRNSITLTSTKVIKGDFIKLQVKDQNGSIHYQYYDTKVETTNYINASTGESTGGSTYSPPSTLSFISDYDIGTLSGKIGRAWEILKDKFNNLTSGQHEGDQPGGGITFTSSIGEGTNRGPKRPLGDATPESIDLLVATIAQLKTTVDARERSENVLEAIERSGVGGTEAGENIRNLLDKIRDNRGEKSDTPLNTEKPPETKNKPDSVTITIIGAKEGNGTKRVPVDKK